MKNWRFKKSACSNFNIFQIFPNSLNCKIPGLPKIQEFQMFNSFYFLLKGKFWKNCKFENFSIVFNFLNFKNSWLTKNPRISNLRTSQILLIGKNWKNWKFEKADFQFFKLFTSSNFFKLFKLKRFLAYQTSKVFNCSIFQFFA